MRFLPKLRVTKNSHITLASLTFLKKSFELVSLSGGLKYLQVGNYYVLIKGEKPVPRQLINNKRTILYKNRKLDIGKATKSFKIKQFIEVQDAIRTRRTLRRQAGPLLSEA